MLPRKRGNPGSIPDFNSSHIKIDFDSYIEIKKINFKCSECDHNHLQATINNCMEGYKNGPIKLVTQLMNVNATNLAAGRLITPEQRRRMWTTYRNIKIFFDNWETDLVHLGFAICGIKGKIFISKEQLKLILNIDETCLDLDGSKIQRVGRPAVIFYHSKLPQLGKAKINTSTSITMIDDSYAAV